MFFSVPLGWTLDNEIKNQGFCQNQHSSELHIFLMRFE